jgi:nucleotide-binding universal stress UspA family protein
MHGAMLRIISVPVVPPLLSWRTPKGTPQQVVHEIMRSAEQVLAEAADHAKAVEPRLAVQTTLRPSPPARALADAAADASMLVVGTRGCGGFATLALGSVSRYVATNAGCPVVVVREQAVAASREIVVGVRALDQPAALGFAFEEAALRRARLRAVHAWQWFLPEMRLTATERPGAAAGEITAEARQWLADLLVFWQEKYPEVDVVQDVVHASPGRVLAGSSARADLVVLGRSIPDGRAHPGAHPVAHAVLHHAHGPVAIVPE